MRILAPLLIGVVLLLVGVAGWLWRSPAAIEHSKTPRGAPAGTLPPRSGPVPPSDSPTSAVPEPSVSPVSEPAASYLLRGRLADPTAPIAWRAALEVQLVFSEHPSTTKPAT
jgi:hypothetical protein